MARPRQYPPGHKRKVMNISLPEALSAQIKQVSSGASVSDADVMRQAMIIGLPKVKAMYANLK